MLSKHLQNTLILLVTSLLLGGCATIPIDESSSSDAKLVSTGESKVAVVNAAKTSAPAFTIRNLYETTGSETAKREVVVEASTISSQTAEPTKVLPDVEVANVEEIPASIENSPEIETVVIEKELPLASDERTAKRSNDLIVITRTDQIDRELTYTDSISYLVMIRPHDYLGKIAKREYDNPGQWRNIYQWNKELVGDDPNIIHPYNELKLFKPEHEITDRSYDYVIHAVAQGETLWSIARDWYGDNLAWKLVYSDNEELFNSSGGRLINGMELKIRTSLILSSTDEHRVSSADIY